METPTDTLDEKIRKIISEYSCIHCGSPISKSAQHSELYRTSPAKFNFADQADSVKDQGQNASLIKPSSESNSLFLESLETFAALKSKLPQSSQPPITPCAGVVIPLRSGETVISHGDAIKKFKVTRAVPLKKHSESKKTQQQNLKNERKISLKPKNEAKITPKTPLSSTGPIKTPLKPKEISSPKSPKVIEFSLKEYFVSKDLSPTPLLDVPKPYPYKSADLEQPSPTPHRNITINLVESIKQWNPLDSPKTADALTARSAASPNNKKSSYRALLSKSHSTKFIDIKNPIIEKRRFSEDNVKSNSDFAPRLKRKP
ncbi:unnamed protein product [Blepharisma stoltei]|uniref:Uncharacterized protein n=1 Tax=Blepharisma stoltei TaxID=1481888 RepID=A0AAU9IW13_9CILI|nr:unnamed protein product [Blepharisma stoltei]